MNGPCRNAEAGLRSGGGPAPSSDRLRGAINSLDSQGQTGTQASITPQYLLAHLRAARVRAQLAACEIDAIGVALKAQMIDADEALLWLEDVDALRF